MKIRAGYRITFDCQNPMPIHLMLSVHPDRRHDLITPDTLRVDRPEARITQLVDGFGNLVTRVAAPAGPITFASDFEIADSGLPDPQALDARPTAVEDLPADVLPFILGSRYCETDRLSGVAWSRFGQIEPGWARVQAIVDYVHERIEFGYHYARPTRTAEQGHEERTGVCRDFAHLAVALCRSMNIPARYCTGYLGDIGVPYSPSPMDFSAWFEVYLGGRWITFDARHNKPRIGRIVIARGRDATDVAITHTFGTAWLTRFEVITEEISDQALMAAE
ncbi:transglutaminase family protein [Phenylobacterium sp.]|uniref:transglutaminase-like domain-containing protein n=1 Tax=Phenylobacterium sp. TaxID=1871053 RepID=UPI00273518F3|nr:transglutaminase family protein [Phenylobacterium sp.]MDP3659083.1 transglutaminase family protein [Phenylobacterium sp.]